MGTDVTKPERTRLSVEFLREARDALRKLEITPVANSIDGIIFNFEYPLASAAETGGYVDIKIPDDIHYFGQIMGQEIAEREGPEFGMAASAKGTLFVVTEQQAHLKDRLIVRVVKGYGRLLGKFTGMDFELSDKLMKFQDAPLSPASPEVVDRYFAASRPDKAPIDVGTALYGTKDCRVYLRGASFNRHTFLTGQSRSGKSFALGVILEQLLITTTLRIVVIDPNSDFTKFAKFRSLADLNKVRKNPVSKADYEDRKAKYDRMINNVRILGKSDGEKIHMPLRIRFSELTAAEKPAVLRLDPLENRGEFHSFQTLLEQFRNEASYTLDDIKQAASRYFFEELRNIGLRIVNLDILDWGAWAKPGDTSMTQVLNEKHRLTVIDVGALRSDQEKLMASMVVLGHFWEARSGQDVLIVIDEAHNVAPATPVTELQRVCTDLATRIAGEGLKYGIYLMIATQRPGRVSECDVTMRQPDYYAHVFARRLKQRCRDVFSNPRNSDVQVATFQKGNALVAGPIVHGPTFIQFDGRLSEEGGL